MPPKKPEVQMMTLYVPKSIHRYLKKLSYDKNISMNAIIVDCLERHKKKSEKDLTGNK